MQVQKRDSNYRYRRTIRDIYKAKKSQLKAKGIDYKTFKKYIKLLFDNVMQHLIDTGEGVKLPKRQGVLYISKRKMCKHHYNRWLTKHLGERINLRLYHTDGWMYIFKWETKTYARFKFRECYKFVAIKSARIALANAIFKKQSYVKYYAPNTSVVHFR